MKSAVPFGVALALAAAACAPATAQRIDLPLFSACTPATQPQLPRKWRAVALMAPFTDDQLDVGEFVYDGELGAMRATVYGTESGAVDLLITDEATYRLSGPHAAPTGCKSLGKKFGLPPRQWLSEKSICVGEAPLAEKRAQWWKSPKPDGRTDWYWFDAETRTPWRTLFAGGSGGPPIVGDYSLTYYPTFEAVEETGLTRLKEICVARSEKDESSAVVAAGSARELITALHESGEAERAARVGVLIPGLSLEACSKMQPVQWPEQFAMSAIITPIRFDEVGPFPTILFYDWIVAETQIARLFLPRARPPVLALLPVLQKGIGFHVQQTPSGGIACTPKYPGMVRPDWMSANGCRCKGVLERGSALGPDEVTQILACPIPGQGGRVMWNWYGASGRPLVFAEAGAKGDGLMLADYRNWLPGMNVPASEFQLPPQCVGTDGANPGTSAGHAERFTREAGASCSNCHTIPD